LEVVAKLSYIKRTRKFLGEMSEPRSGFARYGQIRHDGPSEIMPGLKGAAHIRVTACGLEPEKTTVRYPR